MNKMKKFALIAVCAMLLVCVTIGATVAYLTSTDSVKNTFTVGNVQITLDEADVNLDGTPVEGADRVKENTYHLLPGHTYTKDPIVHVADGSEDCWVFVKVDNGIKDLVDTVTIEDQIYDNEWLPLESAGVYYKYVSKNDAIRDLEVFRNFKLKDDLESGDLSAAAGKTVTVNAYAIQADGFGSAEAAWAELDTSSTTPGA